MSTLRPPLRPGPRLRTLRLVATLLALVVVVHGIGAAMLAAIGPLHTHRGAASIVVLDDLRRGAAPVAAAQRAVSRHGHEHGQALRHHHGRGDASVDPTEGAASQADRDEGAPALTALVAMVPVAVGVAAPAVGDVAATRLAWVPQTHAPAPLERPPRAA